MTKNRVIPALLALACVAAPATAAADGPPSLAVADQGGLAAPRLGVNYFVVVAGKGTVVGRVDSRGGRLAKSAYLPELLVLPAVAVDGTAGGLSGDERTLVLARPRLRFPQRRTTLTVLDARKLRVRARVRLRGDFNYDALSPDGRTLYLIQYTSSRDFSRYAVRAYDLRRERLLPGRIVDRREPDEDMSGVPITRATSADGRWAYTLYDGAEHPFVHALDTVGGEAFCVDLDLLAKDDLYLMALVPTAGGRTLAVRRSGVPVAQIDTRTFRVTKPAVRRPAPVRSADDGDPPWPLFAFPSLVLAAAAGWSVRRRRRAAALA